MKIIAIQPVTTNREVLQRVECDKCGQLDTTPTSAYDAFEFEFSLTTGEQYPEGSHKEGTTMDLCPNCAATLVKLLRQAGFRLTTKDEY